MGAFATELTIDPDLPCELEGFVKPEAVILSEGGVHTGLQRKEAQQMGGEAVHRPDLRFFQIAQRRLGACRDVVCCEAVVRTQLVHANGSAIRRLKAPRRRALKGGQPFTKSDLHLGGCLIGIRQCDGLSDRHRLGFSHQKVDQAVHEQGGFSCAGTGHDDDVSIERGFRRATGVLIRDRRTAAHRSTRRVRKAANSLPSIARDVRHHVGMCSRRQATRNSHVWQ